MAQPKNNTAKNNAKKMQKNNTAKETVKTFLLLPPDFDTFNRQKPPQKHEYHAF